jgi:maltose O-acetyltransferase
MSEPEIPPRRTDQLRRVAEVARSELGHPDLRLMLADLAVRLLPVQSFTRLRAAIYRAGGVALGRGTLVSGRMELVGGKRPAHRLRVGATGWINSHFYADLNGEITLGERVTIGHHVVLITSSHEIGPPIHRAGTMRPVPIVVEDGAWIGARVTVLPGARIGAGSIIAAGSVVVGTIPPGVLATGIPARVKRLLDPTPEGQASPPTDGE